MLTLVNKFNFYQIKIISVSDGIVTDDDNSKLGIHIRGLINELYLDDLKKKTMRGLERQKLRGWNSKEQTLLKPRQENGSSSSSKSSMRR